MENLWMERAIHLRDESTVHYNCAQKVLLTFAPECGISEEQAIALGSHFGGGMEIGSVCGALIAGAMVLGLMEGGDAEYCKFLSSMGENNDGCITCSELLRRANESGIEQKELCDGIIFEAVKLITIVMGL